MSKRKLATIQRISNLEPIPDTDKILKANILGDSVTTIIEVTKYDPPAEIERRLLEESIFFKRYKWTFY